MTNLALKLKRLVECLFFQCALKFLLQFGVQLLMYASPIIYPLSTLDGNLKFLVQLNPITHVIEGCKYAFLGQGSFTYYGLVYSITFSLVVLLLGILIFNKF